PNASGSKGAGKGRSSACACYGTARATDGTGRTGHVPTRTGCARGETTAKAGGMSGPLSGRLERGIDAFAARSHRTVTRPLARGFKGYESTGGKCHRG